MNVPNICLKYRITQVSACCPVPSTTFTRWPPTKWKSTSRHAVRKKGVLSSGDCYGRITFCLIRLDAFLDKMENQGHTWVLLSVTRKKSPNVYKSCPKMISLEKLKILTPFRKLPKNVGDLGKLFLPKALKSCPKSKKSPNLVTLVLL